jgi:hypothetical protein
LCRPSPRLALRHRLFVVLTWLALLVPAGSRQARVVDLASTGGDTGGPSVLTETLFGAVGALAVLVFVFASFLALVPLVIAAVSILATLLLVPTYLNDVSFVVQFLIALVGPEVASTTRCCWSPAGARNGPTDTPTTRPSSSSWTPPGTRCWPPV